MENRQQYYQQLHQQQHQQQQSHQHHQQHHHQHQQLMLTTNDAELNKPPPASPLKQQQQPQQIHHHHIHPHLQQHHQNQNQHIPGDLCRYCNSFISFGEFNQTSPSGCYSCGIPVCPGCLVTIEARFGGICPDCKHHVFSPNPSSLPPMHNNPQQQQQQMAPSPSTSAGLFAPLHGSASLSASILGPTPNYLTGLNAKSLENSGPMAGLFDPTTSDPFALFRETMSRRTSQNSENLRPPSAIFTPVYENGPWNFDRRESLQRMEQPTFADPSVSNHSQTLLSTLLGMTEPDTGMFPPVGGLPEISSLFSHESSATTPSTPQPLQPLPIQSGPSKQPSMPSIPEAVSESSPVTVERGAFLSPFLPPETQVETGTFLSPETQTKPVELSPQPPNAQEVESTVVATQQPYQSVSQDAGEESENKPPEEPEYKPPATHRPADPSVVGAPPKDEGGGGRKLSRKEKAKLKAHSIPEQTPAAAAAAPSLSYSSSTSSSTSTLSSSTSTSSSLSSKNTYHTTTPAAKQAPKPSKSNASKEPLKIDIKFGPAMITKPESRSKSNSISTAASAAPPHSNLENIKSEESAQRSGYEKSSLYAVLADADANENVPGEGSSDVSPSQESASGSTTAPSHSHSRRKRKSNANAAKDSTRGAHNNNKETIVEEDIDAILTSLPKPPPPPIPASVSNPQADFGVLNFMLDERPPGMTDGQWTGLSMLRLCVNFVKSSRVRGDEKEEEEGFKKVVETFLAERGLSVANPESTIDGDMTIPSVDGSGASSSGEAGDSLSGGKVTLNWEEAMASAHSMLDAVERLASAAGTLGQLQGEDNPDAADALSNLSSMHPLMEYLVSCFTTNVMAQGSSNQANASTTATAASSSSSKKNKKKSNAKAKKALQVVQNQQNQQQQKEHQQQSQQSDQHLPAVEAVEEDDEQEDQNVVTAADMDAEPVAVPMAEPIDEPTQDGAASPVKSALSKKKKKKKKKTTKVGEQEQEEDAVPAGGEVIKDDDETIDEPFGTIDPLPPADATTVEESAVVTVAAAAPAAPAVVQESAKPAMLPATLQQPPFALFEPPPAPSVPDDAAKSAASAAAGFMFGGKFGKQEDVSKMLAGISKWLDQGESYITQLLTSIRWMVAEGESIISNPTMRPGSKGGPPTVFSLPSPPPSSTSSASSARMIGPSPPPPPPPVPVNPPGIDEAALEPLEAKWDEARRKRDALELEVRALVRKNREWLPDVSKRELNGVRGWVVEVCCSLDGVGMSRPKIAAMLKDVEAMKRLQAQVALMDQPSVSGSDDVSAQKIEEELDVD